MTDARQPMNWKSLLCADRVGKDVPETPQAQRSPFQRDYDRIVFSSAFRRLQDKTQVFPMAESDYVRTRLTHSLEAACVGRSLGTSVGAHILERNEVPGIHASDIGAIVAAACLAHDIGNPPFGHSGEDAIQHWFQTSPVASQLRANLSVEERADFDRFEGNAQGFRILTRLQMPDNRGGLQLTCATLGAFAKYPVDSTLPKPERRSAGTKKFSFFHSEGDLFREVAVKTGLIPVAGAQAFRWRRHPLAFLVEAADDICYRLVDFEDGFRVGILGYETVREAFLEVLSAGDETPDRVVKHRARADAMLPKEAIEYLRAIAIGRALDQVAEIFVASEDRLLRGEFECPLIDSVPVGRPLENIVRRSRETIYASVRGVEIEAAGFEVIGGLLDLFVGAVEEHVRTNGVPGSRSRKLLQLVPEQFIGPQRHPAPDPGTRVRRIVDFVSGMTDSYAVGLYKKLRGISLPGQ